MPASFKDVRVEEMASAPARGPTSTRNRFESFGPGPAAAPNPFLRSTEISRSASVFGTAASCRYVPARAPGGGRGGFRIFLFLFLLFLFFGLFFFGSGLGSGFFFDLGQFNRLRLFPLRLRHGHHRRRRGARLRCSPASARRRPVPRAGSRQSARPCGSPLRASRRSLRPHNVTHREKYAQQNYHDEKHAQQLLVAQHQFKFADFVLCHSFLPIPSRTRKVRHAAPPFAPLPCL